MELPVSFLAYERFRHLRWTALLLLVTTAAFVLYDPIGGRHGGTLVGYSLGAVSAGLVLWLLWFGVRKRRYDSVGAPLRGWLSAHVYLGSALLVVVPLHCAFQFGWNLHTLAYVLIVLVVVSGMACVLAYALIPGTLTTERAGRRFDSFLQEISDIDAELRSVGAEAPDAVAQAVACSTDETRLGGGFLRQLSGRNPRCGNARALVLVGQARAELQGEALEEMGRIATLLTRKEGILRGVRRDLRQRSFLNLWLFFHVPLALAAVVTVVLHVFVVFWYW